MNSLRVSALTEHINCLQVEDGATLTNTDMYPHVRGSGLIRQLAIWVETHWLPLRGDQFHRPILCLLKHWPSPSPDLVHVHRLPAKLPWAYSSYTRPLY
jgi:hypothetical protein